MNENEFFREATLQIGSDLAIEKALFSTLQFLRQVMPVDWMAIEHYDQNAIAMRTIAIANIDGCKNVDLVTPLSGEARQQAEEKYDESAQKIYLFENPSADKLAKEMLDFHGIKATSLLVLPLGLGVRKIGTLAIASLGTEKFIQAHADLFELLSQPFAMALSNTLKHRNELRLFDRDFFWEMTQRICGNLEIEEGLHESLKCIQDFMPADRMYLQRYQADLDSMHLIARADNGRGEKMDHLVHFDEAAKNALRELAKVYRANGLPPVLIVNNPKEEPVTICMLNSLNEPMCSALSLPLVVGQRLIGTLVLLAEGENRFDENHAKLFHTLKIPFFVALANTLKHREILQLKDLLADDNRYLRGELRRLAVDQVIGANYGLKKVMFQAQQVCNLDSPVLLLGETGVGKDVIANTIHFSSQRKDGPFIGVNCGAIPDSLIDSELFGHEKGAFTGALSQKRGRFERANNGTIFLDEIGELPLQAQVRLLKVLQDKEIERVGGSETIPLNIRIIAATNRNLPEMIEAGEFREDLWFRLNVFPVEIPPLRDRKQDIPAFIQYFIQQKAKEMNLSNVPTLATGEMDILMDYNWPGNVRELQNVIERALILNPEGPLTFEHMSIKRSTSGSGSQGKSDDELSLNELTSKYIQRALDRTNGKIHGEGGAAEQLGINANTLRNRMNKLGIEYKKKQPGT